MEKVVTRLSLQHIFTLFGITIVELGIDKDCLVAGLPKDRYKYLEFVGDRVLNLCVSLAYPAQLRSETHLLIASFGDLTSNENIGVFVAQSLGLKAAKPRHIADQVEACCGALYFEGHQEIVQKFATTLVSTYIQRNNPVYNQKFVEWAKRIENKIEKRAREQYERVWVEPVEEEEEEIILRHTLPSKSPVQLEKVALKPTIVAEKSVLLSNLKVRSESFLGASSESFDDLYKAEEFDRFASLHELTIQIEPQLDETYFENDINLILIFEFGGITYKTFCSAGDFEIAVIKGKAKSLDKLKLINKDLFQNE